MKIKGIMDENFQDYKYPSMMIATCSCDWKCLKENELDISICQNSYISKQKSINIPIENIISRYIKNNITRAIVFGGLEPMLQFNDVFCFIKTLRECFCCDDDVVIYTGYYPEEIQDEISKLKTLKNIVIKFGRFIPDSESVHDNVLGIILNSNNQFAERIS